MKTMTVDHSINPTHQNQYSMNIIGYIIGGMAGLMIGGFTFMKMDLAPFWSAVVSVVVAGLTSFCGAGGVYVFNKWAKPWLNKKFKKKR